MTWGEVGPTTGSEGSAETTGENTASTSTVGSATGEGVSGSRTYGVAIIGEDISERIGFSPK
jgi:hypothetical protein